jgi:hypothetical protein
MGVPLGIAIAIGFLLAVGIAPRDVFDLSIRYHADVAAHFGTPHGLWRELIGGERLAFAIGLAGIVSWAAWLVLRRATPTTLELAVLASLVLQSALVPFSYIQYTAPVLVLAAIFLPCCGEWAPRALLAGAGALAVGLAVHSLAVEDASPDAGHFAQVQNAVLELAPRDQPILVAPPFHPIVRRDAVYGLIQTPMPSGATTEETLRRLAVPVAARFGTEVVRRELETSRPAVVLFTGRPEFFYSGEQAKAIAGYLADHAREYRRVVGIEPALWVRADLVGAEAVRAE